MKKCSLCGEKALEGIEICPECLKKAAVDQKQIKRLRQISNILSITADTDTNIKVCMQSITEIADDLERGSYGKEEKKTEDGIPLLPDACRKSDSGSSGTEVGSELWK